MYTYMGEVFREIRQGRNISLKNATGDAFSYSMLSRFENGESDISAAKLLVALENIHMELEEFVYLVRGFQPTSYTILQKQLWEAHDQQNMSKLEKMYQDQIVKYHQSPQKVAYFLNALLIKAHMILFDERVEITEEESGFLSDYLFSVEIWGEYELRLFSEMSVLLPLDLYYRYTREMLVKTSHLKDLTSNRNYIHTILLNGFFKAIDKNNRSKASYFDKQIQDSFFGENEAYFRIIYLFASGQFDYISGKKSQGKEKMEDAIRTLKLLNCNYSADYYTKNRDNWLKKFE